MPDVIFRADATTLDDIAKGFDPAGITQTSLNEPLEPEELAILEESLSPAEQRLVRSGRMRIVPREKRTFRAGRDEIGGYDFDLTENETVRRTDPILWIRGPTARRTAVIVAEILEKQILIDTIKSGLLCGIDSREFKVSIADLSRLQCRDSRLVYDEVVQMLISGSVRAVRKPAIPVKRQAKQKSRQAMPIMVS